MISISITGPMVVAIINEGQEVSVGVQTIKSIEEDEISRCILAAIVKAKMGDKLTLDDSLAHLYRANPSYVIEHISSIATMNIDEKRELYRRLN